MRYSEILGLNEDLRLQDPLQDDTDARYSPEDDSLGGVSLDDTRKPKLTLRMINRLKKIRSTKNLEMAKKQELLGIMYGQPDGDEDI